MDNSNLSPQRSPADLERLVHQFEVQQIELELQNDELQRTQAALALALQEYTGLYDGAPVGYVGLDGHGRIVRANLTAAGLLAAGQNDLAGQPFSRFVAPPDQDAFHLYCERLDHTSQSQQAEIKLVRADGQRFYAGLEGRRVEENQPDDSQAVSCRYRLAVTDISRRVQAEQLLQQTHARLEQRVAEQTTALQQERDFIAAVLDTAGAAVVVTDRLGRIVRFNQASEQISGYALAEVQGRPFWEALLPPEESEPIKALFQQIQAGQFPGKNENHWLTKDGQRRLLAWSNSGLRDSEGAVQYVVGVGIDITEQREAEEAYQVLVNNSLQGLAIVQDFRIVFANQALAHITGYPVDQLLSMTIDDLKALLHPDDRLRAVASTTARLAGKDIPARQELRFMHQDGTLRWVASYASRIEFRGWPAVQVAYIDITERKQAEEALRQSQARLGGIISTATDAIITMDEQQRVTLFNAAAAQMFGYQAAEMVGQPLDILLPERFRRQHARDVARFGRTGVTARRMGAPNDLYGRRADGHEFPIEVMISQVEVAGRKLYTAIVRDITERQQAEEIRAFLAAIVNSSDDAIIGKTLDSTIVSWNAAAEELYGYRAEEMMGQSLIRLVPPDLQADYQRLMAQIRHGQRITDYETHRLTKDGRRLIVSLTLSPIKNDSGVLIGASAIARDITRRKQTELQMANLLETVSLQRHHLRALTGQLAETQEAERKALARELHDQVGQKLTVLNLNLNVIRSRLTQTTAQTEPVLKLLDQSLQLVESTTEQIQDVLADLRPPVLDDYGLKAALQWYAHELAGQTPFTITVQGQEPAPRLAAPIEHTLFRIAQEALTNVTKHARASQVIISLVEKKSGVCLVVADNGRGFDPGYHAGSGKRPGWGLLTMVERAEAVGGHCHFKTAPGEGTRVIVEIPR